MEEKLNCVIYKITSPSGKVYIGETVNVERRLKNYKALSCKNQRILHRSLIKYGWEAHTFEIIELCEESELKCRERYWQDFYESMGKNGLNCKLTRCGEEKGRHSEETKQKIGKANSGENNGMFGKTGENSPSFGRIVTEETKIKYSKSRKALNLKGENHPNFGKKVENLNRNKVIINIITGEIYESAKIYCENNKIPHQRFTCKLNPKSSDRNDTDFVYYKDYLNNVININKEKQAKKVINTETGKIHGSIKSAWKDSDFNQSYSKFSKLIKERSDKINFKYLEE